eukprot:gene6973-9533_t
MPLYGEWIDLVDIANLDSAVNVATRKRLRMLLKSKEFVATGRTRAKMSEEFLEWLSLRHIKLKSMVILPSDLTERIISRLNLTRVEAIKFEPENVDIKSLILTKLFLKKCVNINKIEYCGLNMDNDQLQHEEQQHKPDNEIGINGHNLQFFKAENSSIICDDYIIALAKKCNNKLHYVTIRCCDITNASVTALANHCPNIIALDISYCHRIDSISLIRLIQQCNRMQYLELEGMKYIPAVLDKIACCLPNLCKLNIGYPVNRNKRSNAPSEKDLALKKIINNCSQLKTVITDDFDMTPSPKLVKTKNCFTKDKAMAFIFQMIDNIEVIDLHETDDISDSTLLQTIQKNAKTLHTINLSNCKYLTEQSISTLLSSTSEVQSLLSSPMDNISTNLKLISINITGCSFITDNTILLLKSQMLQHLVLDHCKQLSSKSIVDVAKNCPNLISFSLNSLPQITDSDVQNILQVCTQLSHLSLDDCTNISDMAIYFIASRNSTVKTLDLQCNGQLTDLSISYLVDNPHQISLINIRGCSITQVAVNYLLLKRPSMRIITSEIKSSSRSHPHSPSLHTVSLPPPPPIFQQTNHFPYQPSLSLVVSFPQTLWNAIIGRVFSLINSSS